MVLGMLIFNSFLFTNIYCQDIIVRANGDEIKAKVLEVTPEIVKYSKFDYLDGPIYSVYIKDITKIIYANGSEDVFNTIEKNNTNLKGLDSGIEEKRTDTFIDERDGNEYKIVKIGDQWWMAENLKFKTKESSCLNSDSEKCKVCGYHYDFYEAKIACPKGWHLPTDDEWMKLEIAVGMTNIEARKKGWRGTGKGQARKLLIDGESGLEIEFCGKEYLPGHFMLADAGFYWTSTTEADYSNMIVGNYAWSRHFKLRESINRDYTIVNNKFSVRCIKNK